MKTRLTWIGQLDKLEKDVASTSEQLHKTIYGETSDVAGTGDAILHVRGRLVRTLLDRGRVWRGLSLVGQQGTGFTLSTAPPPDPAATTAPVAIKHNIQPKTVLHAFKEVELPDTTWVPAAYVGEFRAAPVNESTVTLEPTIPLTGDQVQAGRAPGRWALYEVCPVDGHEWLEGKTEQELTQLMPIQATGLSPADYQKFISQFLRDGKDADEVNDPPDNIWVEVEFKQPYKVTVDAPAVASVDTEPFNSEGQAQLERLRRAPPGSQDPAASQAEFAAGERAVLDKQTADKRIADGVATKVKPIFRRRLVEFDVKFHGNYTRFVELSDHIRTLAADTAAVQAAKTKADEQAALLTEYIANMTDDAAKVKFEAEELKKYGEAVAARVAEVRAELSQLYRSNKALSAEMAALSAQMAEDIERRTLDTAALSR
jgi:hypothetical protein